MRSAIVVLLILTIPVFATGEFHSGGSELWKFKGYNTVRMNFYGAEDADPDIAFSGITTFLWIPQITENLSANVCSKIFTSNGQFKLYDLWMDWEIYEGVTLRAGQFLRPIGYASLEPGSGLLFADRPLYVYSDDFGVYGGRDVGACLKTDFGPAGIDLTFTNGSGWNAPEDDSNKQFTAHVFAQPEDWMKISGTFALFTEDADTTNTFTCSAFGGYAALDYPTSDNLTINFVGEYLSLGWNGEEIEGMERKNGSVLTAMIGACFNTGSSSLSAIQPVVRYETVNPATQIVEGNPEPEDNYGALDYCVNFHFGELNTVQVGGRTFSFETESESDPLSQNHTDIYVKWRVKF